ncbi:MAG: transposase domain-containing protein [Magnetococcales bacterium]|nr:transposase domain-containing protein [Magnetococcales bacterium]
MLRPYTKFDNISIRVQDWLIREDWKSGVSKRTDVSFLTTRLFTIDFNSLIETAKAANLEPFAYLRYVLPSWQQPSRLVILKNCCLVIMIQYLCSIPNNAGKTPLAVEVSFFA